MNTGDESDRRGTDSAAAARRGVPAEDWGRVLTGFAAEHQGEALAIQVVDPRGDAHPVEASENLELRLLGLGTEERGGDQVVLLLAHKHPGAEIAQIEFSGAVGLEEQPGGLSVRADDGARLEVRVSGSVPVRH